MSNIQIEVPMKIVAFLQNPWFQPGTKQHHIELYRDDQGFHRKVLEMSMSGRRLRMAFGDLYDVIHWDNTNWRPAYSAPERVFPDIEHMTNVLHIIPRWDLILTFGNQASEAIDLTIEAMPNGDWKIFKKIPIMRCHHPNARHRTQADLNNFAKEVIRFIYAKDTTLVDP